TSIVLKYFFRNDQTAKKELIRLLNEKLILISESNLDNTGLSNLIGIIDGCTRSKIKSKNSIDQLLLALKSGGDHIRKAIDSPQTRIESVRKAKIELKTALSELDS
ncbi:MAG: hypothetical protein AB1405_15470, partial [Bdellovibrionota bacterium]